MSDKPNLLFVFSDQMRGHEMGCAGNADVRTPNFDRLAAQGTRVTNAISNCPLCVPARGTMITGRYPLSHRAISNDLPMPAEEISIAEVLKAQGYATGYIGKWHLDGVPRDKFTPPGPGRQGFDYWAAWECNHNYYKGKYFLDSPEVHEIEGYEPDSQTDLALRFLEQHAGGPFCLYLSWGPPHDPYQLVPERFHGLYDPEKLTLRPNCHGAHRQTIADYHAGITALDWNFGRILEALDRLGIADNTIVVYTSDHGDMLWSQGRTFKEQPWEESILIPFIVRWPGVVPAGHTTDLLLGLPDMVPTLLGLLGCPIPATVEGTDLSPALRGKEMAEPESVFLHVPLVGGQGLNNGIRDWRGVRTKRHTYARFQDGTGWVLYDNQEDPYQLRNLINEPALAGLRQELEAELQRWLQRTGDKFLPGLEHIRELGLAKLWNESERYLGGKHPRWVEET